MASFEAFLKLRYFPQGDISSIEKSREKIQNREAILNFFEFVALEAGHPYHPGKALGGLGKAGKVVFNTFRTFLQNS